MAARCALGALKFSGLPDYTPTAIFPKTFQGILLRSILRMGLQNLKSVALRVPEIIRVSNNLGSPWIRPSSFFSRILIGFCFDGPCECTCQIWSPYLYPFLRNFRQSLMAKPTLPIPQKSHWLSIQTIPLCALLGGRTRGYSPRASDRQMDGQRDGRTDRFTMTKTALCIASRGKKRPGLFLVCSSTQKCSSK